MNPHLLLPLALCAPLSNSLTTKRKKIKTFLRRSFKKKKKKGKGKGKTLHLSSRVFGGDPSRAVLRASTGLPLRERNKKAGPESLIAK
jgi:hypothetical protein